MRQMDRRAAAVAELERRLGYVFTDRALIERALTHASVGGAADNERLEFLGDRVLALVIAETLLERQPAADAGPLSKRLHVLVSGEACAEVIARACTCIRSCSWKLRSRIGSSSSAAWRAKPCR